MAPPLPPAALPTRVVLPCLSACLQSTPAHKHAQTCRLQSMYGSERERQLASPKPKRPVGLAAAARLATPGHLAVTFGRK